MVWSGADVIIIEIKHTKINVMLLNHLKTIPLSPQSMENCLPWSWSLVPKRLGTTDVEHRLTRQQYLSGDRGGRILGVQERRWKKHLCWESRPHQGRMIPRENPLCFPHSNCTNSEFNKHRTQYGTESLHNNGSWGILLFNTNFPLKIFMRKIITP